MKKNWFFLVTSLVCIIVSMFALTFAWYIGGNAKVDGEMTGLEAVSPEDIAIDIENSEAVEYPLNGADGLIPCSPIGAGIDAISSEEWFIPSFLPSERGRRCCYAFDITVYSSAGFTGTKRISVSFDPTPVNIQDKENQKIEENKHLDEKDKFPLLSGSQIKAKQDASDALVKHIQCAAILLKGNEIGVNQLIAHTDYSIYDEESDYYIRSGRQMDDFYYEFNRHTTNVSEASLNQKIRVLVWIDGFVPDYSTIAGGEAMIAISIEDKTPGSSGTDDPNAAAKEFIEIYNLAKARYEHDKRITIDTYETFNDVIGMYNALPDKTLIGDEALQQQVINDILAWTNEVRYYNNVVAFMDGKQGYLEVKDSYDKNGINKENYTSMRTVINNYYTLIREDAQRTILETEIDGGAEVVTVIAEWLPKLDAYMVNSETIEKFIKEKYEPNKGKVVNQDEQTRKDLKAVVDAYTALTVGQKTLLKTKWPDAELKIIEWRTALDAYATNLTAVNAFITNYYNPIVNAEYAVDGITIGEVQSDLDRFNVLKTEYDKLSQAQKDLLEDTVKNNIKEWLEKIEDVEEYNAFIARYNTVTDNGTKVDITDANREAIRELVLRYDIRIADDPQRLWLVENQAEAVQTQIEAWRTAHRVTKLDVFWSIDNDTDFKKTNADKALTWITKEAEILTDTTTSKTFATPEDQVLKTDKGVTITAKAGKSYANYKGNVDIDGDPETELNRHAKDLGLGYMIRSEAHAQDFLTIELPTDFSGMITIKASPFMSPLDDNGKPTRFLALRLSNTANDTSMENIIESPTDGDGYYVTKKDYSNTAPRQYEFKFVVRGGGTYYLSNVDHSSTVADQKNICICYVSSINVQSATDKVSDFRNAVATISATEGDPAYTEEAIKTARQLYEEILEENKQQVNVALATLESWERAINAIVAIGNIGEVTKNNYLTKETLVTDARELYDGIADAEDKAKVYNREALENAEADINRFKAEDADIAREKIQAFIAEVDKLKAEQTTPVNLYIDETNFEDTIFAPARDAYNAVPQAHRRDPDLLKAVYETYAVKRKLAEDIRNFKVAVGAIGSPITLESKAKIEEAEKLYAQFATADRVRVTNTKATLDNARKAYNMLTVDAFVNAVDALVAMKADPTNWSDLLVDAYGAYEAVGNKNNTDVVTAKATLDSYKDVYVFLTIYNDARTNTTKRVEAVQAYYGLDNTASALLRELSDHGTIKTNIDAWQAGIQVDVNSINVVWKSETADIIETTDAEGKVSAKAKTWFDNSTYVDLEEDKMAFNSKKNGSIVTTKDTSEIVTSLDYTLTGSGSPVGIVAVGGRTYSDVGLYNRHKNLARFIKSYKAYKEGEASTERALDFIKISIPSGFVGKVAIKAAPYNTPTQADRKRFITLRLSDNGAYAEKVTSSGSPSVEHPYTYEFYVNTNTRDTTGYTTFYLSNVWNDSNGANANATVFISEIAVVSGTFAIPAEHNISFNLNGGQGTTPSSQTTVDGKLTSLPGTNPTRVGYMFDGWFTQATGGSQVTAYAIITSDTNDTTLYAHWAINRYKVTFNTDYGTNVASQTVSHGEKVKKPTDPTKDGYSFGGWYKDENFNTSFNFENETITSTTTLYAKWNEEYTVMFDLNGATGIAPDSHTTINGKLTSLPTPERDGYTFVGWFTEATDGTQVTVGAVIESDTTLYAHWTENTSTEYTVTFESNGGTAVTSATVADGGKVTKPTDPTKDGHTFGGWYKEDTFDTEFNFTTDTIAENTTLYAKWTIKSYTVTFDVDGGSAVANQTVTYGGKVTKPTDPTKDGHTFGGWYKEDTFDTEFNFTTDTIAENTTLYAKWTETTVTPTTHTVTFNSKGAGSDDKVTINHGEKVTKPQDPTKAGYTFGGWFTDDKFTKAFDFNTPITEDVKLYAKWTKNAPTEYTVTFDLNYEGSGTAPASKTTSSGKLASLPTAERTGYTLDGWFTEATGGTEVTTDTAITGNITVYAHWQIKTYTVTFKDGEETVASKTVNHGGTIIDIPTRSKTGYTFNGWYTTETTGGEKLETTTVINADDTYYARWTAEKYTVKFYDGTTLLETRENVEHGTHNLYTPNAKEGYTFDGWYLNESCTGTSYDANVPYEIDGNVNFYGKWTKNRYTVTFNVNGGSNVDAQTIEHGEKATKPANDPTKTGFTFGGWYKEESLTTAFDFDTETIIANTIIYAKWNPNSTATTTTTFDFNTNSNGWTVEKPNGSKYNPSLVAKASDKTDKYLRVGSGGTTTVLFKTTASYTNITSISVDVAEFSNYKDVVFTLYVVDDNGTKSRVLASGSVENTSTNNTWSPTTLTFTASNEEILSGKILLEAPTSSGRTIAIDNVVIKHTPTTA